MNYRIYTNSQRAWKVMFDTISDAKQSIYLEMYIFNDDMAQYNFFRLLKEKSKQGLQVKLILDSFGSNELPKEKFEELKSSGIELLLISRYFHRTHRKILIVDEKIAFIGGVNFHQKSELWDDLVVKITGKFVKGIIRSFSIAYADAGGTDRELLKTRNKSAFKKFKTWIVDHSPVANKHKLKIIYKEHINNAKTNITLVTPYLMPKKWFIAIIHQAILRGVKVEILIPKNTDYFITDRINFYYVYKFSKLGVKFFIENNMNHAKAIVIDENETLIGSQNLDFISFDYNSEIGIFFKNEKITKELKEIIRKWKENSVVFDEQKHGLKWYDYLLLPFLKIFFGILN